VGEGWLAGHPDRAAITRRYLANRRGLVRAALGRLADADGAPEDELDRDPLEEEPPPVDPGVAEPGAPEPEGEAAPPPVPLAERRIQAVLDTLHAERARSVIDLGCGTGKLVGRLKQDDRFERITGVDVSYRAVQIAHRRGLPDDHRSPRVEIHQSALTYTDERFRGYDAAVLMEVIEHIDPPRLGAVERVVFGDAKPKVVVVTTPNSEYNVRYDGLAQGAMRHPDHRFEWTRAEFKEWAERVCAAFGYGARLVGVGDDDPDVGAPTQMGVFLKEAA
jgi:3' terminal RNA ribose 2'-O-methyltransferase Hen1